MDSFENAVGQLRTALSKFKGTESYQKFVEPKERIFARYQPVFHLDHISNITAEEFRSFLVFENNRHWTGLHRQGPKICRDMPHLRKALTLLLDQNHKISHRLNKVIEMVPGMGKAIATAILVITYPDQYGVWNRISEAGLQKLEIWPEFERGESFGNRYEKVNGVLVQLKETLEIDLWTLDALWWLVDERESLELETSETYLAGEESISNNQARFGLEKYLHEFLRDNWDCISLNEDWELYQTPEEPEAYFKFKCEKVGEIDLLAKHRSEPRWLVIELKRSQTSDGTVGQVLRYMGWVRHHLAEDGEKVEGLIICREPDSKLKYALSTVPDVSLKLYEVNFELKEAVPLPSKTKE